jgi:hypothetical protein
MRKILLLVEGSTEERFAKRVLGPGLEPQGLAVIPTIIRTKIVPGETPYKGGVGSYVRYARQVRLLLQDSSAVCVSTLLDYYGLGEDFPGRKDPKGATAMERVKRVESAMRQDISDSRYFPFLLLHEFEALLFVNPTEIARVIQLPESETKLQEIRSAFSGSPEDIDDSPVSAPSKRIVSVCGSAYKKAVHGPVIAGRIGLKRIRAECPHFHEWMNKLEAFAAGP